MLKPVTLNSLLINSISVTCSYFLGNFISYLLLLEYPSIVSVILYISIFSKL